jgi:hypothetical protein
MIDNFAPSAFSAKSRAFHGSLISSVNLPPMKRAITGPSLLRRKLLARTAHLGATAMAATGFSSLLSQAIAKGDVPVVQGVHQFTGEVLVNTTKAAVGMPVKAGDRVKVGAKSSAVIVFNKDAFLLRANSECVFEGPSDADKGKGKVLEGLRIVSGAVLSVFKKGEPKTIRTSVATVGIRGTGAYFEVLGKKTYFCLCYGTADVSGQGMDKPTTVETKYHESPLWLTDTGNKMVMEKGPFLNHTDAELEMLEALCGRETPFSQLPAGTVRY